MTTVKDKMKFVIVFNIDTNIKRTYLMPPKKAVLYAWFQYEENRWDWKEYPILQRPLVMVNKDTYSCGDWHTKRG